MDTRGNYNSNSGGVSSEKVKSIEQAKKSLSTWEVLRNRFPASEYVLLEEVSDASGFSRSRSIDFMVVNLWQSRGLAVIGIERKSHRSDWLKELKTPAKQENHFKHCDYFYLLTDKEKVARIEEIPETWGWLHINESGVLKTIKVAPKLSSEPIGRSFLCAMLRRAADKTSFVHIDSLETKIVERAEQMLQAKNNVLESKVSAYDNLKNKVEEFEKSSGISIQHSWDIGKVGDAVRIIVNGGLDNYKRRLENMRINVKDIYQELNEKIDTLTNMLHSDKNVQEGDTTKGDSHSLAD